MYYVLIFSYMTILTGLQANSQLHIGNYFGGIMPIVSRQTILSADDTLYMMVVDLHSYTMPIDHSVFYPKVLDNIRWYLAAGINPQMANVHLFRQSRIPAHTELAWHLSCFAYNGELSRMTQFKDKSTRQNQADGVSVGLFTYPILMAADILLYDTRYIPVGDDQRQHIELTRDIAIRFNKRFESVDTNTGGVFVIPEEWDKQLEFTQQVEGIRIRSLSNPDKKMSKSVVDPKGTILLNDDPQQAAKKIMSSTTDSLGVINWDWKNQAGITNLLQLAVLLSGLDRDEIIAQWQGTTRYGDLKKYVAGMMENFLTDIQARAAQYSDQDIEVIAAQGEQQAQIQSMQTLNRVRKVLGLER